MFLYLSTTKNVFSDIYGCFSKVILIPLAYSPALETKNVIHLPYAYVRDRLNRCAKSYVTDLYFLFKHTLTSFIEKFCKAIIWGQCFP